jgi:hypothetical protein
MRIFKNKWFARFARKNGIDDEALKSAVSEIEAGNFDADLGGYVFKQRVARAGQGKRGGYRAILFFKQGERVFFVFGFAKSEMENISADELMDYKNLAKKYINAPDTKISEWLEESSLIEIAQEA